MMNININVFFNDKKLKQIQSKLILLGNKMATLKEIIDASRAQQDVILAAVTQTKALVKEVKQLLSANDIAGAQELLDAIAANSAELVAAAAEQTDLTSAVDAANG